MFEAAVLACMLPYLAPCAVIQDARGPYLREKDCEARIEEMIRDIPRAYPNHVALDSICYVDEDKLKV